MTFILSSPVNKSRCAEPVMFSNVENSTSIASVASFVHHIIIFIAFITIMIIIIDIKRLNIITGGVTARGAGGSQIHRNAGTRTPVGQGI